ncbi:MAG: Large-conductance mechanosensitive channel [Anaerolineales bacterium]|nr:Large-conductance mechanosensitive channel [Anaerolineales bacterium]
MLKEFKDFIMRGNVLDLAVAVVIGAAFGKIIASLVGDVIMPLIGIVMGGVDFTSLQIEVGTAVIKYGSFIQTVVDFLIIAFVIFLIVKAANSRKKAEPAAPAAPTTKECPYCFTTIHLDATRCPNCTSELKAAKK